MFYCSRFPPEYALIEIFYDIYYCHARGEVNVHLSVSAAISPALGLLIGMKSF